MHAHRFPWAVLTVVLFTACASQTDDSVVGQSSRSSTQSSRSSSLQSSAVSSGRSFSLSPLVFDEKGILGNTNALSVPYTVGSQEGAIEVKALSQSGIRNIANYKESLSDGSLAQTYATSPEKLLFIAGIGKDGYSVYDTEGNNKTDANMLFKDKNFSITEYYRIDEDRYAYGVHAADVMTESGGTAGMFIHRISDGSEKVVPMSRMGLGDFEGIQPLCLSADGQSLYVRYQGWEGFTYSSVWNIRLSDLRVREVFMPKDKIYTYHCSDRNDLILGIRTEVNDAMGMGGGPWPPSSLVLFNEATGSSQTIARFKDKLVEKAVITPDGRSIIYALVTPAPKMQSDYEDPFYHPDAVTELFMMALDGSNVRSIGIFDSMAGMSRDGDIVIVGEIVDHPYSGSEKFYVVNTTDGRIAELTTDGYAQMVECNYGQGFDCHY